tara:strand:- start:1095 stop:1682 length:588 start_codon:yes stop_codon:yes gene_type:complete
LFLIKGVEKVEEQKHILKVLEQTKEAVNREDTIKLKQISNKTIHSASINQDVDSITIAVIIYSLSKLLERTNYNEYPGFKKFMKSFMKHLNHSIISLKQNKEKKFKKELRSIRANVSKISGNFKRHLQDVFKKASINKASRIYEHGISMEKTAKLLGISIWELAEYTGQTRISDVNLNITLPIKQRIKYAEDIFK